MQAEELRALQAPIKALYKERPAAALLTLKAVAELGSEGITCKVETGKGLIEAGLHPATGGDGGNVGFKNVAGDDGEIGELLCEMAKARQERRVQFDGVDGSAGGEEVLGHFTVP